MTQAIEYLLHNSGLPGPRGNLALLYSFTRDATKAEIDKCLSYCTDNVTNSPEEFVAMCGVTGLCILNKKNISSAIKLVRPYASHASWRIREGVAIGIQEIAEPNMDEVIECLTEWAKGNELEQRAVIAALCEPKLLKNPQQVKKIVGLLNEITLSFQEYDAKLSDNQNSLRKTLGYGWSVAIVALPAEGKSAFEKIAAHKGKHIQWIIRENLKKNRLLVMDRTWTEKMIRSFSC